MRIYANVNERTLRRRFNEPKHRKRPPSLAYPRRVIDQGRPWSDTGLGGPTNRSAWHPFPWRGPAVRCR